jgi:hypothetical protein
MPTHPKRAILLGVGFRLPTEVGQRLLYLEPWSLLAVAFPLFPPPKQITLPQYIGRKPYTATDLIHVPTI